MSSAVAPPRRIRATDDTASFDCGQPLLDEWLRGRALASEGVSARTYVVCTMEGRVLAYYCLSTGAVQRATVPRRIRHGLPDPTPVLLLGRFAVDRTAQGRGLGLALLKDALQRARAAADIVGARCVLVHAIDDAAASFYRRFGFVAFPDGARSLFLPFETIGDAFDG